MQAYMPVPWREPTALQHLERLTVTGYNASYIECPSLNTSPPSVSSPRLSPSISLSLSLAFTRTFRALRSPISGQVKSSGSQYIYPPFHLQFVPWVNYQTHETTSSYFLSWFPPLRYTQGSGLRLNLRRDTVLRRCWHRALYASFTYIRPVAL